MITRTMDRPAYIHVTRASARKPVSPFVVSVLLVLCAALALVVFSFAITANEDVKARYIERLKKERQIVETNKKLKTELQPSPRRDTWSSRRRNDWVSSGPTRKRSWS